MKGRMLEDLRAFDLIVARETLTCDALLECGCPRTVLYPDPAFALPVTEGPLPEGWKEGNMVGINAVSYTHLDVYKRQPLKSWCGMRKPTIWRIPSAP